MAFDLNQVMAMFNEHGVPIVTAAAMLLGGWIAALVVSSALKRLLDKTDIDNRIAAYVGGSKAGERIEEAVSRFAYWFVMLLAVMAAFDALGLRVVTEPINAFVTRLTDFMPRILAAGVLAAIAWAVASVLRVVVGNLLGAFQLDQKLSYQTGADRSTVPLSSTIADGVYYLIFLLFLPQILDALRMDGLSPVKEMVGRILAFLPDLFGAALVFLVFYFVARIVQRLATNVLAGFGFDRVPQTLGFETTAGGASASQVAGYVVLVVLLSLGAVQAFGTLGLDIVSNLAEELLAGLFNVLIACVIFAVGMFLGRVAYRAISAGGGAQSLLLAGLTRAAILVFTGAMALFRAGLAKEIVTLAFGALIVGLALAGGLAFGLGGREEAAKIIRSWRESESGGGGV